MRHTLTEKRQYLFLIAWSFVILLLCAMTSPLSKYLATDSAIFFTMGNAFANGKILYKEIFDHKGPLIFTFNALGSLISGGNVWGVYIVESAMLSVSSVFSYKLFSFFIQNQYARLLSVMAFLGYSLNYFDFVGGNRTETYAITFQVISLYLFVRYFVEKPKKHPPSWMYIHGICSACALALKPNFVAMWIPFGAVLFVTLILNRQSANLLKNILTLLAGVATVAAPFILYAAATDSLYDMYFGTFVVNFLYVSAGAPPSLAARIFKPLLVLAQRPETILPLALSIIAAVAALRRRNKPLLIAYLLSVWVSACFIHVQLAMRYVCYNEYFSVFFAPLFIALVSIPKIKDLNFKKFFIPLSALVVAATVVVNMRLIITIKGDNTARQLYAVCEEYAAYMSGSGGPDQSMLTLGILTEFYVVADQIPTEKYFFPPSLPYEQFSDAVDSQKDAVRQARVQYVIHSSNYVGNTDPALFQALEENYELVMVRSLGDGKSASVALYSRK